jgi:hypothetical protein
MKSKIIFLAFMLLSAAVVAQNVVYVNPTVGSTGTSGSTGVISGGCRDIGTPITGTTYILQLTDAGDYIQCENADTILITIPNNSDVSFEIGTIITLEQSGAGLVTVAGDDAVTINSFVGTCSPGQWAVIEIIQVETDLWTLIGGQ